MRRYRIRCFPWERLGRSGPSHQVRESVAEQRVRHHRHIVLPEYDTCRIAGALRLLESGKFDERAQ